ncbi:MAG: CoB--CoM heterodisulfide reductase iron-sulfur subunit A family protein [Elusimicrobiota bacterium]
MSEKTGVYICDCGTNIAGALEIEKLIEFASGLEDVNLAKNHKLLCSEEGKEFLKTEIEENGLKRVVIAACSPKQHESTFMKALDSAGLNPYLMQMVNIREQCAWVTPDKDQATEKAKAFIRAAVKRVMLHEPLEKKKIDCVPDGLVIGSGVSGIEAALTMAQKGRKVYLVEKSPSVGGRVARYEDVFPNLECASCMLEPKLDELLHDDNIEVLTNSEVEEVLGFYGNFAVKIRKKARSVDMDKCIGCGACYEPCPVSVKNEFDEGLSERKAIYVPYPGALPNVPVIDRQNCLRYNGEECTVCRDACPFEAIKYEDEDELIEKNVGGIVLATGFDIFDCTKLPSLGYGEHKEVYTSLEFERILSSTGPTEGKILMKGGREPGSIAIIHCVGSRDREHNGHCSSVCCMYSVKFAAMIKEKLENTDVVQVYRDWTLPGKGYQQFYDATVEKGVRTVQVSGPNNIEVADNGSGLRVNCVDISGRAIAIEADMVILCPAIEAASNAGQVADMFSVSRAEDGFFEEQNAKLEPVSTMTEGIFIAGCNQGPKDIQSSVAQGAAAAGRVLSGLVPGEQLELEAVISETDEDLCSGCKTCIQVCPYKAITYDEEKKITVISEVLCKGCGTCAAVCPGGAASGRHFKNKQIIAEISALVTGGGNE